MAVMTSQMVSDHMARQDSGQSLRGEGVVAEGRHGGGFGAKEENASGVDRRVSGNMELEMLFWQQDDDDSYDHDTGMSMSDFMDKPWKPLTRKSKVPPEIISPYRVLIVIRLVALVCFLTWRIQNPNTDAMWLWGISIVWVPFCRKHNIEPRNPDSYFSQKTDPTKNKKRADFVKDRRWIKREYDEFKIMSKVPENDPVMGGPNEKQLDFTGIDIRLPMFAYVSREKRAGYDHNKKAGAMNAMVRASAILSNGPFILNLDCDHYVYNSMAIREWEYESFGWSTRSCIRRDWMYVQALCTLWFEFPRANEYTGFLGKNKKQAKNITMPSDLDDDSQPLTGHPDLNLPQQFGNSTMFVESIAVAEFQGRPLADHITVKNGRPPGALLIPRPPLDAPTVAEAIAVILAEWGDRIGWIYGSVTEDVCSVGQLVQWRSSSLVTTQSLPARAKFLQRIAYFNAGRGYPSPQSSLLSTVSSQPSASSVENSLYNPSTSSFFPTPLLITVTLSSFASFEVKWAGIGLDELWRNAAVFVIGGTSAHFAAVIQGLLKVIAGVEISFTLTSKSAGDDADDIYADLYVVKWTSLFILPLTILVVNIMGLVIGISRTVYSVIPQWNMLIGGAFFSFWVLTFISFLFKGLMGRRGRITTIIYIWTGLVAITALLWVALTNAGDGGNFKI
ncbi:hypothetical protein HAX54_028169 [Datura stramonium]|uniref:Uncharacterized protein n=1 Tax=Datura stramonium TaxID=4076 RepID=A0ABS8V5T9_DATST|nr:hypothetical protein [Datura stramonium]